MNCHSRKLLKQVRNCTLCEPGLPLGAKPVFQYSPTARILIAGQAPGRRVHESGIPFDDPSGERLRQWMGVSREAFYDSASIAILPMAFCYPGTGKSGDLPPRKECSEKWRHRLLDSLQEVRLTLIVGSHALSYHLPEAGESLTEIVRSWKSFAPGVIPLPHPSPRNNIWLKKNPWFKCELLPVLPQLVKNALKAP